MAGDLTLLKDPRAGWNGLPLFALIAAMPLGAPAHAWVLDESECAADRDALLAALADNRERSLRVLDADIETAGDRLRRQRSLEVVWRSRSSHHGARAACRGS